MKLLFELSISMANKIAAHSASNAATIDNVNFNITSDLYPITTVSRDVIIAICMTDKTVNNAKHTQLISAKNPLT